MRAIISLFKIITLIFLLVVLCYFVLKHVPVIKDAQWNPLNAYTQKDVDEEGYNIPPQGQRYVTEDNEILRNVPPNQARHFFNWIDKYEFMQVNAFSRMGYDKDYLIAERDSQYIMYKFGSNKVRVYTTEHDLYYDLNQLGHQINMRPLQSYR